MLKENHDLEGALKKYIVLLEETEYFKAHEVLEEAWHPLRKADHPLKNSVKGLINGAIAFEHIKRNRKNAYSNARKVMVSFERYKHLATEEIVYALLFQRACKKIEKLKVEYNSVFLNKTIR
jgi:hypothetical protein